MNPQKLYVYSSLLLGHYMALLLGHSSSRVFKTENNGFKLVSCSEARTDISGGFANGVTKNDHMTLARITWDDKSRAEGSYGVRRCFEKGCWFCQGGAVFFFFFSSDTSERSSHNPASSCHEITNQVSVRVERRRLKIGWNWIEKETVLTLESNHKAMEASWDMAKV